MTPNLLFLNLQPEDALSNMPLNYRDALYVNAKIEPNWECVFGPVLTTERTKNEARICKESRRRRLISLDVFC